MQMGTDAFAASVVAHVPEAAPVLTEHLQDNGELLLHLFVADLRRMCEAAWTSQEHELLNRLLNCLDRGLTAGDEVVENAVAVSFVEDSCWWEPTIQDYIATWPAGLQAEVELQRAARLPGSQADAFP